MRNDIVTQLRDTRYPGQHAMREAAADEIERLRASAAATPRINWSKPIETNETPPRSARLVGETKSTLEYFIVEIEGEDHWHPNGEYRVDKETGFIRGKLAIRNCAVTPTRLEGTLLDISAVHWNALRHVIDWWDSLPPSLRQDIEGSGNEPGAIAIARKALPYAPVSRPKPAATPRPDEMREALAALVMFLRGTNTLSTRGAEIEISRLCRNADAALAGPSVSRPTQLGDK